MPVEVSVSDALGRPLAAGGLGVWLATVAPRGASGTVTIGLVGDRVIRQLNQRFRGVDRATDVLSFPEGRLQASGPGPQRMDPKLRPGARGLKPALGDIAIATGVARRQARRHGHSMATEVRVLALHGLLHLLGYDHETDRGQMQRIEERLRRRAGLPSGVIARAPAARISR